MKLMEIDYQDLDVRSPDGAFSEYDAEVLVPEVMNTPSGGCYVEIGVDKGKSLWIARQVAGKDVKVVGVDLRVDPKVEGTVFYQNDSVEVAKTWDRKIDVIFIDGDHSYNGCHRDIEAWYPHMKEKGVMLFHDCDESSPGVMQAVAEFAQKVQGNFNLFKYNNKNTSMARIRLE